MRKTVSKALIAICCAAILTKEYGINEATVITCLLGIIFGYIDTIIESLISYNPSLKVKEICKEISMSVYPVMCLINPMATFMLPVWGFASFVLDVRIANIIAGVAMAFRLTKGLNVNYFLILCLMVFARVVESLAESNEESTKILRRERDYAREYKEVLEEKNRALTENQDNKIYTATLQERNRIAREIHDNVGHMLTRSIMQIGAIKILNKDETLVKPLNDLHITLDTAMNNIRNSVHDLHDESVDLKAALIDIKDSTEGFKVNVDYDMSDVIPKDIKYAFIAIVKEAINNAIKHSNGDTINVSVTEQPGFYQLSIGDNGTNINVDYQSGIGLNNMSDRVKNINGNLKITTTNGFQIFITVIK